MNEKKKLRRLPRRILSFVLTLAMVLTLMPMMSMEVMAAAASSGYTTDEHGLMEYRLNDGGNTYDFKGHVNDAWKQVTFSDGGFKVGVYNGSGLSVTSTPSFIADGQAIMITYTVTNTGSSSVSDCRFYIAADTMIDDNDASTNTISDDVVVMTNQSTGISFFALSSTEGGTAVATEYNGAAVSYTSVTRGADPSTVTSVASAGDSAFVMYFPKETIAAGEKREYTLIVGMGDAASIDTIISKVKKALNASLDYANEKITDLEPGGKYEITVEDDNEGTVTYKVTASADGTIPLKGTDNEGKGYDLIGKKATIIQKADGENAADSDPVEIDVAGRPIPQDPSVPTNTPSDIDINDIETTTNSIKVKAVDGQEYRIGTDGPWKSPDEDGYVTFSGLDQLTEYTIYTRVKATSSAPASVISDGVAVKTQGMFAPTKTEYNGPYDGSSHELKVDANVEGATVTYSESLNGSYNSETFSFKDSGEHKVYYCISKENYYNAYGILTANISNSGHIFSYFADDNKITAKCTDNNCIYHEDGVSLTLTASNANYSGSAVEATMDKTAWEAAGLTAPTIVYEAKTGSSLTDGNAVNVGSYTAKITAGDKTATKDFEITKATRTGITASVEGYTYDGTVSTPTVSSTPSSGTVTYYYNTSNSNQGGTAWDTLTATTLEPGNYYVYATITGDSNYNDFTTPVSQFTVAVNTLGDITAIAPDAVTYDGLDHGITPVICTTEGATISYGTAEGTYNLTTAPTFKNAGTHKIYYKVTKTGYTPKEGSVDVVINKKDIAEAVVILDGDALVENGKELTQKITSVTIDGMDVTYDVTGNIGTKAGEYIMKIEGTGNFSGTVEKAFVIVPAKVSDMKTDAEGNYVVGDGSIVVEFQATGTKAQLVTAKAELIKMLIESGEISAEELASVVNGEDITISLNVVDASKTMSQSAKEALKKGCKGYTIGQYLDIELSVNGKVITNTAEKISISVQIPSELLNKDKTITRTFDIARNHDGKVELLGATYDEKTQSLIFQTDKFSDNAIVYKDVKNKDDKSNATNIGASPKTGDNTHLMLWSMMMVVAFAALMTLLLMNRKQRHYGRRR